MGTGINVDEEEMVRRLEALPLTKDRGRQYIWTQKKDDALLKYWPIKPHKLVARELGVSDTTALEHYRKLTEEKHD